MSAETQQIIGLLTEIRDGIRELLKQRPAPASGQSQPAGVNTYTKLKGDAGWGIRCSQPVKPGDRVKVKTKNNETRTETVDTVVWQGDDRRSGTKVWVCSIVPREKRQSAQPASSAPSAPQSAGQPEPEPELPVQEEDDVPF